MANHGERLLALFLNNFAEKPYFWVALACVAGFGVRGKAADPALTVVNNCPALAVVNNCPVVAKSAPTVTYRPAQGHSHTCTSCGETWDHAKNASHNCPVCNRQQLVIDQPSRMVQVRGVARASLETGTGQNPVETANKARDSSLIPSSMVPTYALPASMSGCPNGNCATVQAPQRRGLFR